MHQLDLERLASEGVLGLVRLQFVEHPTAILIKATNPPSTPLLVQLSFINREVLPNRLRSVDASNQRLRLLLIGRKILSVAVVDLVELILEGERILVIEQIHPDAEKEEVLHRFPHFERVRHLQLGVVVGLEDHGGDVRVVGLVREGV